MIHLSATSLQILSQLNDIVEQISHDDFCTPSPALSGSTIGQHLRHTLEFFLCLERGFQTGIVNYDKRAHDRRMESDRTIAITSISSVCDFIAAKVQDKALALEVCYGPHAGEYSTIVTNYCRELAYNIEHAIHHMAIMKIGLKEIAPYVKLPAHFGVAGSTVRYQETLKDSAAHGRLSSFPRRPSS